MYGKGLYHRRKALAAYRRVIIDCLVAYGTVDLEKNPEMLAYRSVCLGLGTPGYELKRMEDGAISQYLAMVPLDKRPGVFLRKAA